MEEDDQELVPTLPGRAKGTLSIIDRALNRSFESLQFGLTQWQQEVRAVSQMAAATGDFESALKGYEMIGKHMGAQIHALPANAQHLHIHDADMLEEVSDADLLANINKLNRQKESEAPPPRLVDAVAIDDGDIEDLL